VDSGNLSRIKQHLSRIVNTQFPDLLMVASALFAGHLPVASGQPPIVGWGDVQSASEVAMFLAGELELCR